MQVARRQVRSINRAYLSLISDQGLRTIVITGRPDFNAPDWRNNVPGHPMTDQEITDVVAWLASQRPNRATSVLRHELHPLREVLIERVA